MICASSGLPADKLVPVDADRKPVLDTLLWFVSLDFDALRPKPVRGQLPFAEGHVGGIQARMKGKDRVIITNVSPLFAQACTKDNVPDHHS